jgi:hypothetical protein
MPKVTESTRNLALLTAMADDPEEHGLTSIQADLIMWAEEYIKAHWDVDWKYPDDENGAKTN